MSSAKEAKVADSKMMAALRQRIEAARGRAKRAELELAKANAHMSGLLEALDDLQAIERKEREKKGGEGG